MPNSFKKYKLNQLILSANTGLDAIKRAPIVNYNSGIRCLRIQDVSQKKEFSSWGFCEVSPDNIKRFSLKKNDIIIARTGETVGVNYIINDDLNAVFNNGLIRLKLDENICNSQFVYYSFQTENFKNHIDSISRGTSTQPNMQIKPLLDFDLVLPNLISQNKIVSILASLDDKIELNVKMNQTLESVAQAIFKQWFLDFQFPGATGDLENGLPKEWRVGALVDDFNITMGQSPPGESYNENGEGTIFFQGRTDFGFRFPSTRIYTTNPKRFAEKFETLVSVRAPVGDLNMAIEKCCIGRGVGAIIHKSGSISFTYYFYKSIQDKIKQFDLDGTIFGSITKKNFENIEVVFPKEDIIKEFESLIKPFDDKIYLNTLEIINLTQIRDSLLPKLITGQIQVN